MHKDYVSEVKSGLTDADRLCKALGIADGARRNGQGLLIRCPIHGEHHPSCGVTPGPDGTLRFRCFSCQESGDALTLIARVRGRSTTSRDDWVEVLAEGAEIAGLRWLADEIRGGEPAADREQRLPPRPDPILEPQYPPEDEVQWLWESCGSVEADGLANGCLYSRAIRGDTVGQRGFLKVIQANQHLPAWAGVRRVHGDGPCESTWVETGHRLIVRAWDENGVCRSVRAWQCDKHNSWLPKRLPPAGHRASGLVLANTAAVEMLRGKLAPRRLVICEGEPDTGTWVTRLSESIAVMGVLSGSWGPGFAAKIPKTCEVVVRTHCDPAGDHYAKAIIDSLGDRCPVWRREPVESFDDNDLAKRDLIPRSPLDGCRAVNDAARKTNANRVRILSVKDLLVGSWKRATSQVKPKALTTGHWKVDQYTGGIRLGHTWLLGADTSWAKSTWVISMADENIQHGARVMIVSLEDDETLYGDRLMARRAKVNASRLRDRKLTNKETDSVTAVIAKAEPIPVFLDGRAYSWERLEVEIVNMMEDEDVDLVVLDYIQEARTKKSYGDDDRRMFRDIARAFRRCVKTERNGRKRAGLIVSQLTMDDESKAPTKLQIRECKDMAHGAEVIVLGWTPQAPIMDGTSKPGKVLVPAGSRVMKVAKAKDGMKGLVELSWNQESACFNAVKSAEYSLPGFEPGPDEFDSYGDPYCGGNPELSPIQDGL